MAETKRKKIRFELAEHPVFPATNECAVMTSQDLAKHVNALFNRIFADYAGCKIIIDQYKDPNSQNLILNNEHPVQLELIFALGDSYDDNSKKLYAFRPITEKIKETTATTGKMNYVERCIGHNISISQNRSSEITQEGVDILSSMLWYELGRKLSQNPSVKEFNNLKIIAEGTSANNQNLYMHQNPQKYVYNIVKGIDINTVISMLFGFKSEDGLPMLYGVSPLKPIVNMMQMIPNMQQRNSEQKWLFTVIRYNQQVISDLLNELGAYNINQGISYYSDTY